MRLRKLLTVSLFLGIFWAPGEAAAPPPAKIPRIGILWFNPISATGHLVEAFRLGLRERGYVEGQNITIEFRSAEGKLERLPDVASELVRLKVDVIMTGTTPLIRAAQQATRTIPIVMGNSTDPVGDGFVVSLARPGGNITGLSSLSLELAGKRLELLKEVVPKLSRVAVFWDGDDPDQAAILREMELAARALGVKLQSLPLRRPSPDFEGAFRAATRGRAGALIPAGALLTFSNRTRIADLAAKHRLPAMYGGREFVEVGGLMSYWPSIPDMYRRAATYVDKILKGAKPADLPVEQPTRFELVVNLKTAKALGLTIPQTILMRATDLIQ